MISTSTTKLVLRLREFLNAISDIYLQKNTNVDLYVIDNLLSINLL